MSYLTKTLKTEASSRPVPQAFDTSIDDFRVIEGDADGQFVKIKAALPAGSNLLGQMKLTDGSNALVINTNGSIKIVPVDTLGNQLYTSTNLAYMQLPNKVQDYVESSVGVNRSYQSPMYSVLLINDSTTDVKLTVNGITITIKNGEFIDESFAPFTSLSTVATNAYRMLVRGA